MRKIITALIVGLFLIPHSCNKWDEHYYEGLTGLPDFNLYEYMESNPELSTFRLMLEQTGYDSIISASQTFTVWAPDNQALSEISPEDEDAVFEIVENHIARGNYSTSGIESLPVKMLNGKNVSFVRGGESFLIGDINITEPNILANNGQVHKINGYVPYNNNILEFIRKQEGLDSLSAYLEELDTYVFDAANSPEIGFDSLGNVIYDSTYIYYNLVLNELGALGTEDSTYTTILPNNTAWVEAYNRAYPYFNIPEYFDGATRRRAHTQVAIVQDMVFRELIEDPAAYSTLESTFGNTFNAPAELFAGTEKHELSNGYAYITNQMPYSATSSWFKEVRVEAEQRFNRENANSNIYNRSGLGSGFEISNDFYILVDPKGTSNIAQPNVKFSIPDVLSGTYNMYCVFVPASVTDPSDLRPNRARFMLTYVSTTSGRTRNSVIIPDNNITQPFGLTKMLVGQFDFEFATLTDAENTDVPVKLLVTNDVTVEEENEGSFSRTMRIDCIIFEPVSE